MVRAELRKLNIEPSALNLFYEENIVPFGGGGYLNRYITIQLGSGVRESYDVALAGRHPEFTAWEIARLIGRVA